MGSRYSPSTRRGRAAMLMVETSPARLGNVKASLKRSIDRDSLLVQEAGKVKKPRYAGTTLSTPRPRPPPQPRGDPGLQADLADLVKLGKKEKLESWLEERHECVNLNLYSAEGLTPLQEVCQAGGENSTELARLLVRFGADTRLSSRDGWSPVHMASFSGNTALLLFLLSCRS